MVARHDRDVANEDDARRIALSLPETTERPSYGTPGFRVKDRLFARMHDLPDTLVVWVADMDEKEALLASSPDVFFETPHYDGYPMVLVHLDAIDLDELTEVITDSWRARAPAASWPTSTPDPPECSRPSECRACGVRSPSTRMTQAAMAASRSASSRRSMMWSTRP